MLATQRYAEVATTLGVPPLEIESKMKEYFETHTQLMLDQDARALKYARLTPIGENQWQVEQIFVDPDQQQDWALRVRAQLSGDNDILGTMKIALQFEFLGAISS